MCIVRPLVVDDEPEKSQRARRRSRHMSTSRPVNGMDTL